MQNNMPAQSSTDALYSFLYAIPHLSQVSAYNAQKLALRFHITPQTMVLLIHMAKSGALYGTN